MSSIPQDHLQGKSILPETELLGVTAISEGRLATSNLTSAAVLSYMHTNFNCVNRMFGRQNIKCFGLLPH